jgi:hypothetical protein
MSLILLAMAAMFNEKNKHFDGFMRVYGFVLGLGYDVIIIAELLK